MIFGKSIATPGAGRHGDRARAQGLATSNIAGCISDYIDLGGRELAAVFFRCARAREGSEPVTISMIIGERAKFKKVPDTVMLELELRAAGYIASKKRQHEMWPRLEAPKQFHNARKQVAFATWQFERKKMHIAIEKGAHVFVRRRNFMLVQYADDDARVGHAGDFDVVQIVSDTETFFEGRFKRTHTCAARVDQRSIDIEK